MPCGTHHEPLNLHSYCKHLTCHPDPNNILSRNVHTKLTSNLEPMPLRNITVSLLGPHPASRPPSRSSHCTHNQKPPHRRHRSNPALLPHSSHDSREPVSQSQHKSNTSHHGQYQLIPDSSSFPTLSNNNALAIQGVITQGLAAGTQSNYQSAVNNFLRFCETNGVPEYARFATHEPILCAFVASLATSHSGSSASNIVAGLRTWHTLHNKTWQGSTRLQVVIRGVAALAPSSSRRDPRAPVTLEMLRFLHSVLNLNDPLDAAIFAAAVVAFWGQCRLGELLGTSRQHHRPSSFPSRSDLNDPFSAQGSRELHLPRTKTRQHTGDKAILLRQSAPVDPIDALANHFRVNHAVPSNHHLFAFSMHSRQGPVIRCLTKEVFINRCNDVWVRAGFPRITGHCFRIGGTTELLLKGLAPDLVRSMGRWSSDAHLRYWRDTKWMAADQAEFLQARTSTTHTRPDAPVHPLRTRPRARTAVARGRPY